MPPWQHLRPWRNSNPLDLRTLRGTGKWLGQVNTDIAPGGPFAIFASRIMGWRAGAVNLLAYQDVHELYTVAAWCNRWAPPADGNDTSSYTSIVAWSMGVDPGERQDLYQLATMVAVCKGIALAEGGARIMWDASEREGGCRLALMADKAHDVVV